MQIQIPKVFPTCSYSQCSSILLLSNHIFQRPHASSLPTDHLFYMELNDWATSNPMLVVDEDIHHICEHSRILSHAFCSLWRSLERKSKEAHQRRAVDGIIELAFDLEDTSIHRLVYVVVQPSLTNQ